MDEKLFWQHACGEVFDPDLGAAPLYDHQETCNKNLSLGSNWTLLPESEAF